jgi:hypothetical protein
MALKQHSFLSNGSETEHRPLLGSRFVLIQKVDYNNRTAVFSMWYVPRCYKLDEVQFIRVEAGSNTSTVTLRFVGGNGKGNLKSETVKYGHGSQGTQTRERLGWRGLAAYTNDRPPPLARE